MISLRHIALRVPDVREAEDHYRTIFAVELVGREVLRDDGRWYSIPHGRSWEHIDRAGVTVDWVGLRRDDLVIALFPGAPVEHRPLHHIGIRLSPFEMAAVRNRLPDSVTVTEETDSQLNFTDAYGFRWQCNDLDFRTIGDTDGHWLDI